MSLPTRREIAELVAERYGLTFADLQSRMRSRRVAWPRQEAMALMADQGRWSRGQIGQTLNRTCWTVEHGVRVYRLRVTAGRTFPQAVDKAVSGVSPAGIDRCDTPRSSSDVMA